MGIGPTEFFSSFDEMLDSKRARSALDFKFKILSRYFSQYLEGVDLWGILNDPEVKDPEKELKFQCRSKFIQRMHVSLSRVFMHDMLLKFADSPIKAEFDELTDGRDGSLIFRMEGNGLWVVHNLSENPDLKNNMEIRWKLKNRIYRIQSIKNFIKENSIDSDNSSF